MPFNAVVGNTKLNTLIAQIFYTTSNVESTRCTEKLIQLNLITAGCTNCFLQLARSPMAAGVIMRLSGVVENYMFPFVAFQKAKR
jgi:hypothetical protein